MYKSTLLSLLIGLSFVACKTESTSEGTTSEDTRAEVSKETNSSPSTTIPSDPAPPQGYTVLGKTMGDLNKDGIPELLLVYDTPRQTDYGSEREIGIYQQKDNAWELWHTSVGAVLPSEHGGTMGDPFDGIAVENGAITINHFGGSRHRWYYIHRYRYQQGDWYLIGTTIQTGEPCQYWETMDYNLSTKKAKFTREKEACEEEEGSDELVEVNKIFDIPTPQLPKMDGFYPGDTPVDFPELDTKIYY